MARVLVAVASAVLTFGLAACGSGDDAAPTPPSTTTSTTSTTIEATTSTASATTTRPPTTTFTASSTTTSPTSTTTEVVPASSVASDTEAPAAPTNVTCAPGGGSQEVLLEWDAPADPADIVDVRLYVNDGSGFVRTNKFTIDSGQVLISSTRWSAVAYPVPVATHVSMAVTVGDEAGNESGWNPIDVYYEYSGADCLS